METAVNPTEATVAAYHGRIVPYYPTEVTKNTSAPFSTRVGKFFMFVFASAVVGGIICAIGKGAEQNWLFYTGIGVGAIMFIAGIYSVFTLQLGTCPYCHQGIGKTSDVTLSSGDDNDQVECPVCTNWLVSNKGEIRAYTASDVKDTTTFKCKVMENSTWPNECLVCGAPPTRYIELKNTNLNAGMLLVGRLSVSWGTLKNAPYCDQHMDAVSLKIDNKTMYLKFENFETMKRYQHVNYHKFMTGEQL